MVEKFTRPSKRTLSHLSFIVNLLGQIDKACKLFWSLNRVNTVCSNKKTEKKEGQRGRTFVGGNVQQGNVMNEHM